MSSAYDAMLFARDIHASQVRRYTGDAYVGHLAEVTAIAMTVYRSFSGISAGQYQAVCWLHDSREDQEVHRDWLIGHFGVVVADGVDWLSDMEEGNRAARTAASRARLARAPDWVQNIKVADCISNTASIALHDPKFAKVYLPEKTALLDVLTLADPRLVSIARNQIMMAKG